MKKGLKIALIVVGVLVGFVALDTLQAKIFDYSPLLKIRVNLDGGSLDYIDKGLFVNHYHCNNNEKATTWKGTKFACSKEEVNASELQYTYNQVVEYFGNKDVDRDNLGSCYLDNDKKVVIVELINNSKEEQEKFIKQANVNSKYIKFEQGGPYTVGPGIAPVIDLSKPEFHNDIRFNLYASNSIQKVYMEEHHQSWKMICVDSNL